MAEPWTFVEAKGELASGTARTLLAAAERAGMPVAVVRSVYGGFDVPERLLDYLNEPEGNEDEEDLIGSPPGEADAAAASTTPARPARKATPARRAR